MTRSESREQAFILLFEHAVQDKPFQEVLEDALEARDFLPNDYIQDVVSGAKEHTERLDAIISENLKEWSLRRLSKTTLVILRLAVYELLYMKDIPVSVSINEAVNLGKKYGDVKDSSYVNGVLSTIEKKYCDKEKE